MPCEDFYMTNSIFESKKHQIKEKALSVKLPLEMHAEIEEVRSSLERLSPDLKFNVNAICVDALNKAVRKAKKELSLMDTS